MSKSPAVVTAELRATLWRGVCGATRVQIEDLASALDALCSDAADDAARARSMVLAHTIAGTAGVYGFVREARAASRLEVMLRRWIDDANHEREARSLVAMLRDGLVTGR
jgi:chemotaxis protein histidine kinase CheA